MVKYTVDQVLAAMADAERPLSTPEVAHVCAQTAGVQFGESREVRAALGELVERGTLVSATYREPGNPHAHIAYVPHEKTARYWATPRVADEWGRVLVARSVAAAKAHHDGQALRAYVPVVATVDQEPINGAITVTLRLDGPGIAALLALVESTRTATSATY